MRRGETGERRNPTPSFLLSPRSPRALRFRARYTINGAKRGMFLETTHHGADSKDLEMWHSKFHSDIAVHCKACFSSVFTENKGHKKLKCLPSPSHPPPSKVQFLGEGRTTSFYWTRKIIFSQIIASLSFLKHIIFKSHDQLRSYGNHFLLISCIKNRKDLFT